MFSAALYSQGLHVLWFVMVFSWIKLYQYKQSSNETVTVSGVCGTVW